MGDFVSKTQMEGQCLMSLWPPYCEHACMHVWCVCVYLCLLCMYLVSKAYHSTVF